MRRHLVMRKLLHRLPKLSTTHSPWRPQLSNSSGCITMQSNTLSGMELALSGVRKSAERCFGACRKPAGIWSASCGMKRLGRRKQFGRPLFFRMLGMDCFQFASQRQTVELSVCWAIWGQLTLPSNTALMLLGSWRDWMPLSKIFVHLLCAHLI